MSIKFTPEPVLRWFAGHYGSRRGFALAWWYRLNYWAGGYRNYRRIDWGSVNRIVFVCKGNICRSAFAEIVARADNLDAVSCGIEAGVDVPAYDKAIEAAARRGYSLREHRTIPLRNLELRENDLLVAMEPWQADHLHQLAGRKGTCTLLGLWGRQVTPYIHDPYGAPESYFDNCFNYLEIAVHEIKHKIKEARNR